MADQISPEDLSLYRIARQQCAQTEVQLQQAQHNFQQAQQAHLEKIGALKFVTQLIASRPGFPEGGQFNVDTGAITVASPASPGAHVVAGPHEVQNQATKDRDRKFRVT